MISAIVIVRLTVGKDSGSVPPYIALSHYRNRYRSQALMTAATAPMAAAIWPISFHGSRGALVPARPALRFILRVVILLPSLAYWPVDFLRERAPPALRSGERVRILGGAGAHTPISLVVYTLSEP